MSYDYLFKYIIIGDTGVGKSCLLLQFLDKRFRQKHEVTIGVEFGAKLFQVDGMNIKLQIWDTAGQESFKSITRSYYRSAAGAIVVYDITRRESFNNVAMWLEEAKTNGNPTMTILLVGNKSDMDQQRQVTTDEGKQLAADLNIQFVETSAKTGHQVDDAFLISAQSIVKKVNSKKIDLKDETCGVKKGTQGQEKAKQQQLQPTKEVESGCC